MAKYYIVSRNDDKYDLISVGHKVKLEDIDKYTLNFNKHCLRRPVRDRFQRGI